MGFIITKLLYIGPIYNSVGLGDAVSISRRLWWGSHWPILIIQPMTNNTQAYKRIHDYESYKKVKGLIVTCYLFKGYTYVFWGPTIKWR